MLIEKLKSLKKEISKYEHFNATSPQLLNYEIDGQIKTLNELGFKGQDGKRIKRSISILRTAQTNAELFAKGMKPDLNTKSDLAVTHDNPDFWYQKVIGEGESAYDLLLYYYDDDN